MFVQYDLDTPSGAEVSRRYDAAGVPTFRALDARGAVTFRAQGVPGDRATAIAGPRRAHPRRGTRELPAC